MKIATWAAVILAVAALLFLMFDGGTEAASSLSATAEPVEQRTSLDVPLPLIEVDRVTSTAESDPTPEPTVAEPPVHPVAQEPKLATMEGRFLLPDGNPAVGVNVKLWGFVSNDARVRKHGMPKGWKSLEALTDGEGRFEFFFDPPQAYQLFVDATLAGYAEANWRWSQLPPGETTDLGTITLDSGGRIEGRLTDGDGRAPHGEWHISADTAYRMSGSGGDRTRATANVNLQTGAFALVDLPPGPTELKAYSRQTGWVTGPTVEVRAGTTVQADIIYAGPDNRRRITIVTFCEKFHIFSDDIESAILHGAASGQIHASPHGTQSFSFDGLDPASEYHIEITGRNFLPYTESGLRPGNSYNAYLVGSAAVALKVVDAASAEELHDYRVTIRYRNIDVWPNEFEIRGRRRREPKDGVYREIVPGDISIIVQLEDSRFAVVDLDDLAPNETRSVVARISWGAKIAGRVVEAGTGVAIAGTKVSLWPTIDPSETGDPFDLLRRRTEAREQEHLCKEATADSAGYFEFSGLTAGFYEVMARQGDFLWITSVLSVPANGEVSTALELPRPGYILGRLSGLSELALDRLELVLDPVVEGDERERIIERISQREREEPSPRADREGNFRLGPLTPGNYEISLLLASEMIPWGFSSMEKLSMYTQLGNVQVRSGEDTRFDADLGSKNPGYINIRAVRMGDVTQPAAGVTIVVGSIESEFEDEGVAEPETAGEVGGQTESEGRLKLGPVFPGDWEVNAHTIDRSWVLQPRRIHLTPGGEVSVDLQVQIFEGQLEIVNKNDGSPVANYEFSLEYPDSSSRSIDTDHRGRLQLRLGPGQYVLWGGEMPYDEEAPADSNPNRHVVQWTASGPVPAVIEIEPGKQ